MRRRWSAALASVLALSLLTVPSRADAGPAGRAAPEPGPHVTETEAAAEAVRSGRPVEVLGLRGEAREVYAQPGGGFVATEHLFPVRTLKDGAWAPVDTTLVKAEDGSVGPVAAPVGVRLSGGGDGAMLALTRAGRTMSLTWPGTLPAPELQGDTALYRGVLGPDVDLRVQVSARGASHVLVVKTPAAARDPRLRQLRFGLTTPGLRVSADARGRQSVTDAAGGGELFTAAPPRMWDSSAPAGLLARSGAVDDGLRAASAAAPGDTSKVAVMPAATGDGALTLTPDQGMLTSPGTVFPVYIDPVWYSPGESANLMVSSGGWEDYGFKEEGMGRCPINLPPAGAYCGSSFVKRLFYRMPTSRFSGKQIISAEFSVKETYAPSCDGRSVHIYRATGFGTTSTWNSTKDNWADYLTYRDVAKGRTGCPAGDVVFNVLSAVKAAASKGWSATTFGLRAGHEDDEYGWKRFDGDAVLRVYYNTPPPQPKMSQLRSSPGGPCAVYGKPTAVNRIPMIYADNLTDPDNSGTEGEKLSAEFAVVWTDAQGVEKNWHTTTPKKQSAAGSKKSSFSVQIPSGLIPVGAGFSYMVRTYDGAAWSPWSWAGDATACYLRYDPTAPRTPQISSPEYPALNPDDPDTVARDGVGRYGGFSLAFDPEVVKFAYALNTTPDPASAQARTANPQLVRQAPTRPGINTLYVTVWDAAGNFSIGDHSFWVSEGAPEQVRLKLDEPVGATALTADTPGVAALAGAGVTLGAEGRAGRGLRLDGLGGGYAATSVPLVRTRAGFTVSAWVRLRRNDGYYNVLAQDALTQSGFQLGVDPAPNGWVFKTPAGDVRGGSGPWTRAGANALPELDTWTHLTGVYDATAKVLRLYVNGTRVAETPVASVLDAQGAFQIGRSLYDGGYANWWPGDVDEVAVLRRAVSDEEAATLAAGTVPQGAAAMWRMEEPAGGSRVYGESAPPTAAASGLTLGVPGQVGKAAQFNGSTGYAATADPVVDTGGTYSVSAWVRLPTTLPAKDVSVVSQDGLTQSGFYLKYRASTNKWGFMVTAADAMSPTTATVYSAAAAVPGQWTHLVAVHDAVSRKLRLLVNGVDSGSADMAEPWRSTGGLQLGRARWNGVMGDYWPGAIDDVRLFDRVVSAEEARTLFTVKSDVTGRWRVDQATGTPPVSADSAPVTPAHPLTLAGGARIVTGPGLSIVTPPSGQVAGALDLPGGDGDYASASGPVADTAASFTVSAWAQTAGVPARSMTVLSLAGATNSAITVRYDAAKGRYVLEVPNKDGAGASVATVEHSSFHQSGFADWDHLAVVFDGFDSRVSLYVNGVLEAAAEAPTVSYREGTRVFAPISSLQLGRARSGGAYPAGQNWAGQIDDVWVLRGAATDDEVAYLANPTEIDEL
ncbi:LamG-like jellyroll fold domain-containing protein [Nonomuraea spiralis]|uniref:LamG-like jellyroll fold domain-containing protein n=1 Tax=Nonomuraea spiralis TaxID=46182 RepID=UPI00379345CE